MRQYIHTIALRAKVTFLAFTCIRMRCVCWYSEFSYTLDSTGYGQLCFDSFEICAVLTEILMKIDLDVN